MGGVNGSFGREGGLRVVEENRLRVGGVKRRWQVGGGVKRGDVKRRCYRRCEEDEEEV